MKIFLFLLLFLAWTSANLSSNILPKFVDLRDVLQALNRTCLVLLMEAKTGQNYQNFDSSFNILSSLRSSAFSSEETGHEISVGTVENSTLYSSQNVRLKFIHESPKISTSIWEENAILILPKIIPDRSCLLAEEFLPFKELKTYVFRGSANEEELLNFINEKCATYISRNGSGNEKGRRRRHILSKVFSVRKMYPDAVSMKNLTQKCGRNLKNFFYTGRCENFCEKFSLENLRNFQGENFSDFSSKIEIAKCEILDGSTLDSEAFFQNFVSRSRPVILKNILKKTWKTMHEWNNAFLRRNFAQADVHVKLTPKGEFEGVEDARLWSDFRWENIPETVRRHLKFSKNLVMVRPAAVDMKMHEFLDLLENGKVRTSKGVFIEENGNLSAYLEYTPVDYFSGLKNQLLEMHFVREFLQLDLLNVWLSNGNTLGKLHFDQYDNLLCQVSGKKRVILFEPYENKRFYEGHIVEAVLTYRNGQFFRENVMENTAMTMSPVDIEKPDFEKYPEMQNAIPYNCTIESGDILYIPSFWWHEVQSYPDAHSRRNLAFNFWYKPYLTKEFPCVGCPLDVNPIYRHLL